ncbi:kelch repeat-containing protein [Cystobacter fuscus]|nr:kelch repeat-containing protein [Cystobacter fuscus]
MALTVAALGVLGGCETRPPVELRTEACSGTPALRGVSYLRWRVTGEGMEPREHFTTVEVGVAGVPAIPPGKGRVVEVRGYTAMPRQGGRVVAVGRSHPFEVGGGEAPAVTIALRRVGEFVRPRLAQGCAGLGEARAGHTATLLEDGRVLLAGGVRLGADGRPATVSAVEMFNPATDTLERVPALDSARAFHTATRLPGGKVLLVGGEEETSGGTRPLASARVLDVTAGTATPVEGLRARGHHAAAADASGRVLVVGGVGVNGEVVSEAEGYDAATGRIFQVGTPVRRVGMGVSPVGDGRRIAVVGGSDGTALVPEVLFFSYQGDTFVAEDTGERLREPRRDAALVPFGGPGRLLYVGGHSSAGAAMTDRLLASSQLVSPDAASRQGQGPQIFARSEPCAVALQDGRVLTLGGWGNADLGDLVSDAHGELFVPGAEGGAAGLLGLPELERSRHQHTCTALEDGSVLIAGGLEEDGVRRTTLDDLLLYMPVPLD